MASRDQTGDVTRAEEFAIGGSLSEVVAGIAGVILSILALNGLYETSLTCIAVLVIGVGLTLRGAAIITKVAGILTRDATRSAEISGGLSTELMAGVGGIILAILALIGFARSVLLPISVIAFGAGVLFAIGITSELARYAIQRSQISPSAHQIAREEVKISSAIQLLIAGAAIVLGIVALLGTDTWQLTQIAALLLSILILLRGAEVSGWMSKAFYQHQYA